MNRPGLILLCFFLGCFSFASSQPVKLLYDHDSPQANYAAEILKKTFLEKEYRLEESKTAFVITLSANNQHLKEEAYSIQVAGKKISVTGGDNRGMIYGALRLAEEIRNGKKLEVVQSETEEPHYSFRAIKFDLPWDTYRHSDALDLHYETCRDLNFWKAFLDM